MRRNYFIALAIIAGCLWVPGAAVADDPAPTSFAAGDGVVLPACDEHGLSTLGAVDCTGEEQVPSLDPDYAANPPTVAEIAAASTLTALADPSPAELPAYCRQHANVYFYTSSDWVRLGQTLAANASPCADYYISIPPLAADKTGLRCAQDDLIRALGPRFHPLVEFHFAGWNAWWNAVPGRTPADAAHEFLKRVHACGYDFSLGETWTLNEMHSGIRRDNPGARTNMRMLLNTLHAGAPDMPEAKGIVWVIGLGQETKPLSEYQARMQQWLQDGPFWADMAQDVSV